MEADYQALTTLPDEDRKALFELRVKREKFWSIGGIILPVISISATGASLANNKPWWGLISAATGLTVQVIE
ncbi:MAG: hypothetical protein LBO73_03955, partial [Holosporaceae bacterium]|nr:hypothetical protein [Holosporaceae bacterium]